MPKNKTTADKTTKTPHDRLVRNALSNVQLARSLLKKYLPPTLIEKLNLNAIKLCSGHFIAPNLEKSEIDVLYRVRFNAKSGAKGKIVYVLIEHQSTIDEWLPLRIFGYFWDVLAQHRKQNPDDKKMPSIYPLILYNGEKRYTASTAFLDLFEAPGREVMADALCGTMQTIDLCATPDEKLKGDPWLTIFQLVLKHRQDADKLLSFEDDWLALMAEPNAHNYLETVWHYLVECGKSKSGFMGSLQKIRSPKLREKFMTIAEQLRKEGRQAGERAAVEETALRMKRAGFDLKMIQQMTRLTKAQLKKLFG